MGDYKTYTWAQNIDEIPSDGMFVGTNGVLIYNNESTRSKIKDAIRYALDAKGYKYMPSGADMIVIFDVTEQPGTLTNYNGYEMIQLGLDSVRTPENVVKTYRCGYPIDKSYRCPIQQTCLTGICFRSFEG